MKREEYIVFVEQKDVDLLATELNDFATLESKTGFMFDYVGVLYENIGLKFEKHDNIDKYGADCCFIVFSINYNMFTSTLCANNFCQFIYFPFLC